MTDRLFTKFADAGFMDFVIPIMPADVYFGRGQAILNQRERIKRKTIETRRLHHRKHAA